MQFIPARNYTPANRGVGDISWIVIHDMEMPEKPTTAESCAEYFRTTTREASAHFTVDNNSIIQCVNLHDVAWAAPGANSRGIQYEFAGFAAQTAEQWRDPYSLSMLKLGAEHIAGVCKAYGIPVQYVDAQRLTRGVRGITTHKQVSDAFKRSNHYDPGPNFPITEFVSMVNTFGGSKVVPSKDTTPSGLVRVNDVSFWTVFPKWYSITLRSRFWAETIALQYKLNGYTRATGRRPLTLDGKFGPATYDFLKAYQYWKGLSQDGIAHPNDARSLGLIR